MCNAFGCGSSLPCHLAAPPCVLVEQPARFVLDLVSVAVCWASAGHLRDAPVRRSLHTPSCEFSVQGRRTGEWRAGDHLHLVCVCGCWR